MRKIAYCSIACAGVALLALATNAPIAVAATVYPWCAHYGGPDSSGYVNCGFTTREQCMATVSGSQGTCEMNVNYPPPGPQQPRPVKPRKST